MKPEVLLSDNLQTAMFLKGCSDVPWFHSTRIYQALQIECAADFIVGDDQENSNFENVRFYVTTKHLKGTVGLAAAVDESLVASLGFLSRYD